MSSLGLITSRVQPGLQQQHDADVVVKNERGDVRSPPGCANGPCTKEADQECVFSQGGAKRNAKQLPMAWMH